MPKTHDGGGRDASDTEWLFDFLLSVFKSPSWDLAVMGFIDENCAVFDTEEENKLSYTTLHRQFKDLVETLCANSLAEVGVAVGDFVDALEASRFSQDISTAVYQQLVALDDFVTFKKLMVKRNVELELEAVHALQKQGVPIQHSIEDSGVSGDEEPAGNGEEKSMAASNSESKRDKATARPGRGRSALDRQLRKAMDANLQELELMHKREEVEQAELEQAIAMSLALEAKRSEQATLQECLDGVGDVSGPRFGSVPTGSQAGCKGGDDPDGDGDRAGGGGVSRRRQSKERDAARELTDVADDAPAEAKCDFVGEEGGEEEKRRSSSSSSLSCLGGLKKGTGAKALPPLSKTPVVGEIVAPFRGGSGEGVEGCSISSSTATMIRDPDVESAERRREAREASEKARKFLEERRQAQKALKAQSEVSEEDSAQRERHLKNMRDRIVSAKRAGREEEASKAASESAAAAERGERAALPRTGGISTSSSPASGAATQGDLTKWKGDAIVNAANEWMLGGGGVDGAIHRAAGRQLLEACYDVEPNSEDIRCPTGEARITPGFRLPAKFVIHTVGPVYETKEVSAPLLRSAIKNSLLLCKENGVKSVAFPAISCGVYGYPAGEAAEIAIDTMLEFSEGIDLIEFVLFGKDTYNPFMKKASEKLAVVKEDSGGSPDDPNAPKASSTSEPKTADEGAPNTASGEVSPSAGGAAAPTLEEKQKPEEPECTKPPAGPTSEEGDAAVEPMSISQEENFGTLDGSVEKGTEEPMSQEQTLGGLGEDVTIEEGTEEPISQEQTVGGLGEDVTPAHGGDPMPQAVSEGPGEDTPSKTVQDGERQVPDRKRPAPDGKARDSSQAMETEEPHKEAAQEAGEGQAEGVEAVSRARDSSPPTEKR